MRPQFEKNKQPKKTNILLTQSVDIYICRTSVLDCHTFQSSTGRQFVRCPDTGDQHNGLVGRPTLPQHLPCIGVQTKSLQQLIETSLKQ